MAASQRAAGGATDAAPEGQEAAAGRGDRFTYLQLELEIARTDLPTHKRDLLASGDGDRGGKKAAVRRWRSDGEGNMLCVRVKGAGQL